MIFWQLILLAHLFVGQHLLKRVMMINAILLKVCRLVPSIKFFPSCLGVVLGTPGFSLPFIDFLHGNLPHFKLIAFTQNKGVTQASEICSCEKPGCAEDGDRHCVLK